VTANLDVVRSILANWERGDLSSMDWADRDIDFVFADGPEPGTHVGRAAMQELFRSWLNSFATISLRRARPLRTCSSCAAAKSRGSSCTSTATRP
jgi:hypothetical protein